MFRNPPVALWRFARRYRADLTFGLLVLCLLAAACGLLYLAGVIGVMP